MAGLVIREEAKKMTREEARNLLKNSKPEGSNAYSLMLNDALDMAIKALEQEPCEDAISRQAAIDAMIKIEQDDIEQYGCSIPEGFDSDPAVEALENLPSVKPQYTDAEIQKMQEMEQAEIEKAYELGKAEQFDNLDEMLEKLWNEVE
jgi:hypothetical protein